MNLHTLDWDDDMLRIIGVPRSILPEIRSSSEVYGEITWDGLEGKIDPARHAQVAAFLAIQEQEAQWWRDASIAYFQTFSKRPLPAGEPAPPHSLAYYQALQFPFAPGDGK